MKEFEKYGALLEYPWQLQETKLSKVDIGTLNVNDTIIGNWAEDGCPFQIKCPPELAGLLVEMQNKLSAAYRDVCRCQNELRRKESQLNAILK